MIDLKQYGYQEGETSTDSTDTNIIPARVTEVRREMYKVICTHGEVKANLTGSFYKSIADKSGFPAVGDFVFIRYNEHGLSGIVKLLPRKSKFSRADYSGHLGSGHSTGYVKTVLEQVVATNFDYVFIMSSLNQDFSPGRIVRYLTAAYQSGGTPVVILTKADLCPNVAEHIESVAKSAPDVDIIALSSVTGEGIDKLNKYLLPEKTLVFLGMSGVGKSSLLNALAGESVMKVKEIRDDDARGRHTTTHRQLVMLPSSVMIIDTPGMRELGLLNADEAISEVFSDVEELFSHCKFSDCRHESEPQCAVKAALADGTLTMEKWESYLAQKNESNFAKNRRRGTKQ